MENKLAFAILATVCYADIFDFPLNQTELYARFIINKPVSKKQFQKVLEKEKKSIAYQEGYYFLPGRSQLIKKRQQRTRISAQKFHTAYPIIRYLSYIPGTLLIGISGSLAVKNCSSSDDIDLFIITEKNMLWIVRLLTICILFMLRKKRSTNGKRVKDKICTNMFLSVDSITIPIEKRSVYMAYEIGQMDVVINKDNTYEKFVSKNRWAKKFLPHFLPVVTVKKEKKHKVLPYLFSPMNTVLFYIQYLYMKQKITRERVGKDFAFFHPLDREKDISEKFQERVSAYENLSPKKVRVVKRNKKNEALQVQTVII